MLLNLIFLILIIGLILITYTPSTNRVLLKQIGLLTTGFAFFSSVLLLNTYLLDLYYFQSMIIQQIDIEFLNINLIFGVDKVSLFFILLSALLIFLCILVVWDEELLKEYLLILISIDLFLIIIFSTLDLLFFYAFFEAILIPMYLMIGLWGSRERKIRAAYLFFFYTLLGSLCMIVGLFYLYSKFGSLNYEYLYFIKLSSSEEYWLWLAFFMSFAVKIPLFPFHIWLPEAHVEAPSVGSILLAGILLKLGVYGFLRFNLTLFPEASFYFSPLIFTLSIAGIIYASLSALRQTDFKRIIAYSSVAHMNLVTLGLFSLNSIGIIGSIIQSISHGFVSSAMFLLIGILYKTYHSRQVNYFSGLTHTMPLFSFFFLFFTLANIALPGTSSFIGEFLILFSAFKTNFIVSILGTLGVIVCGSYSLWLYNRVCFGNLKNLTTLLYQDINFREFIILITLLVLVLFLGLYPNYFFNYLAI